MLTWNHHHKHHNKKMVDDVRVTLMFLDVIVVYLNKFHFNSYDGNLTRIFYFSYEQRADLVSFKHEIIHC
jgi:hypothetical protein